MHQFTAPKTRPEDMAQGRYWTDTLLAASANLPFSFRYDGKPINGIPAEWNPVVTTRRIDANIEETVYTGTECATGLTVRVEALKYRDYPVVEWIVWLTNAGEMPTPLISDIHALDATFAGQAPILQHGNGDFNRADGYATADTPLPPGTTLTFAPEDGRACDRAFPYFRVQFAGCGLTLAIGWPAQWSATYTGVADGVAVQAGQQRTHLRLQPGECIRTPRITMLSWVGDTTRAINLWRRWYLAHILPRPDGQPLRPMLAVCGTEGGEEFTGATEENQLRFQEQFARAGIDFDVWWIDAGWYPCRDKRGERHWPLTGTWTPDPERFPRGLQPVAANAAQHGARLLLWHEPERVTLGSRLDIEHPEWLLRAPLDDVRENEAVRYFTSAGVEENKLLNLGNPACRQWLTDYISTLIRQNGVGIYRQDFNFPPLPYWQRNDAEDRQGMLENQHVQGYLQFWDDLLARHPGLWIDSCAAGGRRNDLETMRRSVPLHYSDYGYGLDPVKLAFHHTLFTWIPYFKEITLSADPQAPEGEFRFNAHVDSYTFHVAMAAMVFATPDANNADDVALSRKMIAIWRRAAEMLLQGDYYPLTPGSRDPTRWVSRQFDRPEYGDGFLQGIRHPACPDEMFTAYPHELQPDADYLFENAETGEQFHRTGADLLRDGVVLSLPPRNGVIWFYRRG